MKSHFGLNHKEKAELTRTMHLLSSPRGKRVRLLNPHTSLSLAVGCLTGVEGISSQLEWLPSVDSNHEEKPLGGNT